MERNEFSTDSAPDLTGASAAGSSSTGSSSTGSSSTGSEAPTGNPTMTDRVRDIGGATQEQLADVGSTVRDRAGNLKASVANALDSGADKLRHRGGAQDAQLATATNTGVATVGDGRIAQMSDKVAGKMEATAGWLRDADVDGLKSGIETQVKDHPGRTLLIAAGLGYLLGKALRK
jgi:ElaB/YqjD/DUF883 family membrane-anchored ribosome-binding protein